MTLEDYKDFMQFLFSDKCIHGCLLKNKDCDNVTLVITKHELEDAIRQYFWGKL